jgi:hypothetical protein
MPAPLVTFTMRGAVAGAVGKVALDAVTYLDMLVTGRPPSDLPERAAAGMVARFGIDLSGDMDLSGDIDLSGDGARAHRRTGLAALMGYGTGLAMGAAYGAVRGEVAAGYRWPAEGFSVGLAAMAGTAVPSTLSGLTDPRRWGLRGWMEDIVPHLAYGLATAATYRALVPGRLQS